MTPTGEFALFPTPTAGSGPRGIALGPDGRLWFTETALGPGEVGTIGTDGTFGPSLSLRRGYLRGEIAFGSEGDAWMPYLERGLVRMRPNGRQKGYMQVEGAVVAGREGDIWSLEWTHAWRIVPRAAR